MSNKSLYLIVIGFLMIACSSDDSTNSSIDLELLYGLWFVNSDFLCEAQNNLTLNQNGEYIRIFSGNSCEFNESNTVQYSGTYSVNGDNISFNQLEQSIIEQGDVDTGCCTDTLPIELIRQKIIVLTENELVIERKFRDELSGETFFSNWSYVR